MTMLFSYLLCTVELPCDCTDADLSALKQRWEDIVGNMPATQQLETYQAMLNLVASLDADLATTIWSHQTDVARGHHRY